MSEKKPSVNILLLGDCGAGKSTFINSFANYIKHGELQDALQEEPDFRIPARFVITDDKYNETLVSIGDPIASDYKAGKSVTQEVTDYIFEVNEVKLRLIDTPGVGDSRGVQQDEEIIKKIVAEITKYGHLNAIAFVLKSNVTVLDEYFKFCVDHLLSQLDESAYQNVVFIFTHSRGTFYRPGETLSIIQRLLQETKVVIPLSKENMFCMDNEAFRYLVAQSKGLRFTVQEEKAFEDSWNQSVATCRNLIRYIVGDGKHTGLKPRLIKARVEPKDVKLEELFLFLADLSCGLEDNLDILSYFKINLNEDFTAIPVVYFEKALTTGEAVYVCSSLRCTFLKKVAGVDIDINTDCCASNTDNMMHCITCNCSINLHRYKKYFKKMARQTIVQSYETQVKTKFQKITTQISLYEYELQNVLHVLAALMIYVIHNYKPTEDPFIAYLRNEKHVDYKNLRQMYYKIKTPKETYTKIMQLEVIVNGFNDLKKLKWTGGIIKYIFGDEFNINIDGNIEDKVKKTENLPKEKSQGNNNKNQEFKKFRNLQSTNDGREKPYSYADADKAKLIDANLMQLQIVQDAVTKINQSSTEIIKPQASISKNTEMKGINQKLLDEIKILKQQNGKLIEQQEKSEEQINIMQNQMQYLKGEFDSIKQEVKAKNHDIISEVNNFRKELENIGSNKLQATTKYQELIHLVENLKQEQEILRKHVGKDNTGKKCEAQCSNNQKFINKRIDDLKEDVKNVQEFIQELSKEFRDMKEELFTNVEPTQSTSNIQDESNQPNQEGDNNGKPKIFQKLIDDINHLKKFKEIQTSQDENCNIESEISESVNGGPPKFQKLLDDLSNLKQLKEQKDANENNEVINEVKRINEQQETISKQLEDLKSFIKDTMGDKSTDAAINHGQKKKKKSAKNN